MNITQPGGMSTSHEPSGQLRVGITGQAGFIGTHLFNTLRLSPGKYRLQPFEDGYFQQPDALRDWVAGCDVIVHLAAMNRHGDPQVIYDTNLALVRKLIDAMEAAGAVPGVIFASSTQEERDNPYGRSKREGRALLAGWAARHGAVFTGLVIPNVFGPFGLPYYNSAIATFSHQLTHGEAPHIDIDGHLKLIYVGELAAAILQVIDERTDASLLPVAHTAERQVSDILRTLLRFKETYFERGEIPLLNHLFELQLFNTFRCFIDPGSHFPVPMTLKTDERGSFVETVREATGGQCSFSTTRPGVTRGNHFHTRKIERFAVIRGKACIRLRRIGTGEVLEFFLSGEAPAYVDMPVWYTHNITNTGDDDLYTLFWINEPFDPADPDTYPETV